MSYAIDKDTRTITVTNSHTPDKPRLSKSGIVATGGFSILEMYIDKFIIYWYYIR